MRLFTMTATDRIAASAACSYGLFWAIALAAAIVDRKSFRPDLVYFIAAGCAAVYISISVLALCRIKGAARLLQITTIISTALIMVVFGMVFFKESLLGRGLLIAFGQLQVAYAVGICLLLRHKCQPDQELAEEATILP